MSGPLGSAGILVRIALRDLVASRGKTAVVGGIVLFAAALAVAGGAVVDAMDRGMAAAVQGSLSGQLQIQDARSRDAVALYGGSLGEPDLTPFDDFARVKAVVAAVPGVKAVVPMGVGEASLLAGSAFETALEELRADVRERQAADRPELAAREASHLARVRRMAAVLRADRDAPGEAEQAAAEDREQLAALERTGSDAFWAGFARDPLGALELLENRVAPLAAGAALPVRYVGTDLEAFRRAFDRLQVVEGQLVPPGARGLLLGKRYADEWLKLKTARRLDQIHDALRRHRRLAGDAELTRAAGDARRQAREILLQLDPLQAEEAARRLRRALGSAEPELARLLEALLQVDDANFEARYRIFYGDLAPLLRLYAVRPGDTVTLQAATRSGYTRAVNVKVWGFVQFRGLETSSFAAASSLLDLLSFRDLYGWLTPERAAEIRALQRASGTAGYSREEAETALFGAGSTVVEEGRSTRIVEPRPGPRAAPARPDAPATQAELDHGVAPHAAVLLDDPGRTAAAALAIEAAGREAGLPIRAVSWQEASGVVGEFVAVARLVLWAAVAIVLAVALVIVSNALVIATLQRVSEIGTLRAIGAQRGFVRLLVVGEALAVGIVFGAAGAGLGAGLVTAVRAAGGIPALTDELVFVFSGPALLPTLSAGPIAVALAAVLAVTLGAALYPALLATRVSPLAAMQTDD